MHVGNGSFLLIFHQNSVYQAVRYPSCPIMQPAITQTIRQIHRVLVEQHHAREAYAQTSLPDYQRSFAFISQLMPNWVVMLCGIQNHTVPYVSENCREVFGYASAEMEALTPEDDFLRVHPDDLGAVHRLYGRLLSINKNLSAEESDQYRFLLHYRYRHASGHYFHLHDEKLAMRNQQGKLLYITLYKDITHEQPFQHVRLDVLKQTGSTCHTVEEYVPQVSGQPFTRREAEILKLIKDGLSSKEIADRLCISEHTVRNHRSRLFEKTNAKSVVELLNFAALV